MSTQLHLVSTGPAAPKRRRARRAKSVVAAGRRPWVLDAQTVRIGREGVAEARRALERAARPDPEHPLSKAS
jgi:hypothetical protein